MTLLRAATMGMLVAGLASCGSGEESRVPLRYLAEEHAGSTKPATLTLGQDTRYVLGPAVQAVEQRVDATPNAAGRIDVMIACPPELAGERAYGRLYAVRAAVADRTRAGAIETSEAARALDCPLERGVRVPMSVAAPAGAGPIVVRAVVEPAPAAQMDVKVGALPRRAYLRVAVGVRRSGAPPPGTTVHAAIRAVRGTGAGHTLWQGTLSVPPREERETWHEVEVPLEAARVWVGAPLRLVFDGASVEQADYDARVVWADPTILGRPSTSLPAWNVIVISLDTLRADRLGTYGYPLGVSPVLDDLARAGTVFERAVAQANWTLPSHLTMLTGTYPCVHGVIRQVPGMGSARAPAAVVPLAEMLREAGFVTAAFTENAWMTPEAFQRGFGSFRADQRLDPDRAGGLIEQTIGAAVEWMERHAGERLFLFLHTYEVHAPYVPPAEYARRIPSDPLPLSPRGVPPSVTAREDAARYVAEVAFADATLRTLFDALDRLGLRDRTIVLVTSDHGEAFGEHGSISHGTSLFEEEIRVPMIWRAPGLIEPGRRVRGLAGLVDVTPTVLDLLGLPIPPWMQGRSLAPQLRAGAPAPGITARVLPLHGYRASGVTGASWKILGTGAGEVAFDLRADAGERRPIRGAPRWSAVADRSRGQLEDECARGRAALGGSRVPSAPARIDPERDRKLRALGYVQ